MSDLISRQAAIDAHCELCPDRGSCSDICPDVEVFKLLPSVQPERIIYTNMSDKEFEKWLYEHGICQPNINEPIQCKIVPMLIDDAISELPSVQERKGRWKSDEEEGDIMCSCCGDWWASGFETAFHYCPNCGASMTEGAEE